MSIFAHYAPKYFEKNLTVIPVYGKKPAIKDWPGFCHKGPSNELVESWMDLKSTGMSLICGPSTGICGIDVDVNDKEIHQKISAILPPSPVAKKGRRGFTAFYRFDFSALGSSIPSSLTLEAKGSAAVDVLLAKHTVMPPSIHPVLNEPYKWYTDLTILDTDLDDLPLINMETVNQLRLGLLQLDHDVPSLVVNSNPKRNEYLKGVLSRLVALRLPADQIIDALIEKDAAMHGSNALFSDKSENSGCSQVYPNALRFFASNYHSWAMKNERSGQSIETPINSADEPLDKKFPHLPDGFFKKEIIGNREKTIMHSYEFADYMIYKHHFYSTDAFVRFFDQTHYRSVGKHELGQMIDRVTKRNISNLTQKATLKQSLLDQAANRHEGLESIDGLINLKNGIFDLEQKKLLPHNPKYHFTYCLDYEYEADAGCPNFMEFLYETFSGDEKTMQLIQEYLAYTLISGPAFLHKALCFLGSGRNGKSTLLNVIKNVLGISNVSSVPLSRMDEPFAAVGLDGKLANIVEELTTKEINSEAFKTAIGGGNLMVANKGKDNYIMPVTARFYFAANDMPVFQDATVGLHEKIIFVDFPNYIPEDKRDPFLDKKLMKEISGIFNWALGVLPFNKNFQLTVPAPSKTLKDSYISESNSVAAWFDDCVEITGNEHHVGLTVELYANYKNWCDDSGNRKIKLRTFGKRLNDVLQRKFRERKLDLLYHSVRRSNARGYSGIVLLSHW